MPKRAMMSTGRKLCPGSFRWLRFAGVHGNCIVHIAFLRRSASSHRSHFLLQQWVQEQWRTLAQTQLQKAISQVTLKSVPTFLGNSSDDVLVA